MARLPVWLGCWLGLLAFLAGCTPRPEVNVAGYLLAERLGTLDAPSPGAPGAVTGLVLSAGEPLAGATVVLAERTGRPHTGRSDAQGRYTIAGIPPGQYVPAAVAPGFEETAAQDWLGMPYLVTVTGNTTATVPALALRPHVSAPLPTPLDASVQLSQTASYTAATVFPPGAVAQVTAYAFTYAGATVDTLRLYVPLDLPAGRALPMLFMVYPTHSDRWESVSVGLASAGYALVAVSPVAARAVDIDAHAQDARVAFALARQGALGPQIGVQKAIALGGSFSSPILHRFLRDEGDEIAGWVTVGGISDAFSGAADFYAGRLEIPPEYRYIVPALGAPNLYPLPLLRYSPVYTAAQLPPTMIIHTDADRITPIDQAYELEAALRAEGVPVEVYYYPDVSHYLQIGEDMTPAGVEMFSRILDFARRLQVP
jgi:acetyl esterase/lipase